MATKTAKRARKDEVIQIRASGETKALLQRAADLRGQKLSEFVLKAAHHEAEDAILDQRLFILSPEDHEKFLKMLEQPFEPSAKAIERARRKPVWEK
jgi:uncharacterized protein (DUF1778 family)